MEVPFRRAGFRTPTILLLIILTVVVGLASRQFPEWFGQWLSTHAGDALWSVVVYLGLALIWPRATSIRLAIASLLISFLVEFSQCLDWEWLQSIRKTLAGRLVLGQGFQWWDLVRYTAGVLLAAFSHEIGRRTEAVFAGFRLWSHRPQR